MTSRRSFIQSATALSAAAFVKGPLAAFKQPLIGLQLYTVRDAMEHDPVKTLGQVAKIGYNSVEAATYTGSEKFYGMDPATLKKVLADNGLVMLSGHYRLGGEKSAAAVNGTMLHDWQKAVDDAAAVGMKYMVCAYLSEEERSGGLDRYKSLADEFNRAAKICHESGIQFCYHNHNFEFAEQSGLYPYDILLDNTDRKLVKMEMDLYWVKKAGQDPVALFKKYPGRFPLWHVKDMDNTPDHSFTEVGNGIIDFKSIFYERNLARMEYFFVEQDKCPGSPFDSIAKSYNYIKSNLL